MSLLLCQLAAPWHAILHVSPCSCISILQISGSLFAVFLPMVPSFGSDVGAKLAVDEQRVAVVAPWTAKKNLVDALVGGETAVVEHGAVRL